MPRQSGGKKVSLADLIVLGGCAAIEKAAKDAGHDVKVPFTPGRMDASQEQTDVDSFAPLEPVADGFRNYLRGKQLMLPEEALVDRAQLLTLTAPEMTVLVGGLRVLGANAGTVQARRLHQAARDADERLLRQPARHEHAMAAAAGSEGVYEGRDRKTNEVKWTGTRVDLIFGSHSQLRAFAEVYACADSKEKFVQGLRGGVDQGDERGSLRPRPDSAITCRGLYSAQPRDAAARRSRSSKKRLRA